MPILHLGVIDQPYNQRPAPSNRKRPKVAAGMQTTGDVAGWLETRYHVMEIFYEVHKDDVFAKALEDSVEGALQSLLMGAPATIDIYGSATSAIEIAFKKFIDTKEMDSIGVAGVPTHASIIGIRSRFKNRRDPGRPSFQDTGLYETSFKAWVDS